MKRINKYKDDLIQIMDQTGLTLKEAIQEINENIETDKDVLNWLDGEFQEFQLTQQEHDLLNILWLQGYESIQRQNKVNVHIYADSCNIARQKQTDIGAISDGMFEFLEPGITYQIEYLVFKCKIKEDYYGQC